MKEKISERQLAAAAAHATSPCKGMALQRSAIVAHTSTSERAWGLSFGGRV